MSARDIVERLRETLTGEDTDEAMWRRIVAARGWEAGMSDREELAAAIHEQRRRRAPLTISLGYYDLDPEDQGALLAMADDVLAALGIPAATLAGLRDGSLVAVPHHRHMTDEMAEVIAGTANCAAASPTTSTARSSSTRSPQRRRRAGDR